VAEINSVDLSRQTIYAAEWFVIVALVEELDLVRITATSQNNVVVLFAELSGI
jgi:hypothetical protein